MGRECIHFKEDYCFLMEKPKSIKQTKKKIPNSLFRAGIVFGSCFSRDCNTGMRSLTCAKVGSISLLNMCLKRHKCQNSGWIQCLDSFDA